LLIAVPDGLSLGGVTSWACSTANTLAAAGRIVGIIRHARRKGDIPIETVLDPRVHLFDATNLLPMDDALGACGQYEAFYDDAVMRLSTLSGGLCVAAAPTQMGDCWGIFAALKNRGRLLHLLAWRHSLSAYERAVVRHYEPWLDSAIAISEELAADVESVAPGLPCARLPHAIEPDPVTRPERIAGEPWRLIFVGRLEHGLKRASLLPLISDELHRLGVDHMLHIVGDGELAGALRTAAERNPSLKVLGTLPPEKVREALRTSDLFLLPSRTEGLSVSLLGAMASGCVPVVTETLSGVRATVTAETGHLVPFREHPDEQARLFAEVVKHAAGPQLARMSAAAKRHTLMHHHPTNYLAGLERVLAPLAHSQVRKPASNGLTRSPWFTERHTDGSSGTVPSDAAERMREMLDSLQGRRVLIHGTGQHTCEVLHVIRTFDDRIVGYIDDDPAKAAKQHEGLMVYAPDDAAKWGGATDVVVSSFIHQQAMAEAWAARDGPMQVHLLYEPVPWAPRQ